MKLTVKNARVPENKQPVLTDVRKGDVFIFTGDTSLVGIPFMSIYFDRDEAAYHFVNPATGDTWSGGKESSLCNQPIYKYPAGTVLTLTVTS